MADKTPVRVVFNASNVATGMAEFQSGESVGTAFGGTGLTSIGSAGQVLKVNAAGNALEFAAEGDVSITNLVAPTNADLTFTTSGTGNIVLDAITVRGTTLNSADSSAININENLIVDGTASVAGALTASTSLNIASDGATVTGIKDEDNMASNSATKLATQQSIKAYVDSQLTASDLDIVADDSTAVSIDLDSETLGLSGGTGIGTSISNNTVTFAIDTGTVVTKEDTQTLTNKTLTAPNINNATITGGTFSGTFTGTISPGQVTTNSIVSNGSNADISIQPSGTGDVILSALRINGTTIDSSDSSAVQINENTEVDGTLTVTGAVAITSGTITGITDLAVADGGTGASTFTDGGILLGSGSGAITATAALGDGEVLVGDGSGDPVAESGATLRTSIGVGTGDSPQFTGIELGHASDTTITRASSGNLNIEGNLIYRAGGTDVPVADGGTGASTHTANAILLGNGSSAIASSSITISGTTLATGDSTSININEGLIVDGTGSFSGNLTASADLSVGDDLTLGSDSAVLNFGADSDTTLTHTDGTGLTLNSTNKLTFGDVATFIQQSSDGVMRIDGEATVDINASTAVTISNDLKLDSDAAVLGFGVNNEITLTHVHDTGLLLQDSGGTPTLQLHDANESIASDGSKVIITSGGTTFNLPTADGDDGQALITNGSGTLSFGTVGDASVSDDSAALVVTDKRITSTARTVDSFHKTFQDSVLYYIVSNDHNEDAVNVQKVSVAHNDTGAFVSSVGVQSKASTTMTAFTVSLDNDMVRLKAASSNAVGGTLSFYKFGLGDNTSTGTSGNIIISQNTDVDSTSESLVSFAHATFRGAKLFISINNTSEEEVENFEAMVVHDGSDAYIAQFNGLTTADQSLLTLTAAIDGSNVVVSAAGLDSNLRVTVHAIMLKDNMTSNDGTFSNAEAISSVTISSSATEIDTLAENTNNGAVYYIVSKNASESAYAINEVFLAMGSGEITVANSGFVSTKGTNQLSFTSDYKDDAENLGQLLAASTSGASTTVSAYRINLLAK